MPGGHEGRGNLVVTKEQLDEGYEVKIGERVENRRYTVVRELEEGKYEVIAPDVEAQARTLEEPSGGVVSG